MLVATALLVFPVGHCDEGEPETFERDQHEAPVDPRWAAAGSDARDGPDPTVAAKAKVIWDTRCARCHGRHGAGKDPHRSDFDPPPRNFQDRDWQAATPEAHIRKVIVYGGPIEALSPAMPGNLDLANDPELLHQIVKLLRGMPHWSAEEEGAEQRGERPAKTPTKAEAR